LRPDGAVRDSSGTRASVSRLATKLVRVIPGAVERFFADRCPQQAAAIAYRVLFSVAPLAIVLVSIFGLVLQNDSFRQIVVDAIVDALSVSVAGRNDVEDAITAIATPASAAGLVSLLLFGWAASGMMASLRQGLERAMHVAESRPLVRGKLVDLALIAGAAFLVLVTVGITVLGNLLQSAADRLGESIGVGGGTLVGTLVRAATFVLTVGVVLLLYRFVPARGLPIRDAYVGAILTAVLLLSISLASGWIFDKTTRLSVIYGSLTAALVFLYSVYLSTSALLLGAEVAAHWSLPEPSGGAPTRQRLREAVLGLFVRSK